MKWVLISQYFTKRKVSTTDMANLFYILGLVLILAVVTFAGDNYRYGYHRRKVQQRNYESEDRYGKKREYKKHEDYKKSCK